MRHHYDVVRVWYWLEPRGVKETTMDLKISPRPWKAYRFGRDTPIGPYIVAITVDPKGDRGPIRGYTVTCGQPTRAGSYWPAEGVGGRSSDEAEANAILIAAAPDFYAACAPNDRISTPDLLEWVANRMVDVYGENPNVDFVHTLRTRAELMRAALRKARGEVSDG